MYTIAGGDARVLTYSTCLSCTLLSIARSYNLSPRQVRSIIQQALSRGSASLGGEKEEAEPPDLRSQALPGNEQNERNSQQSTINYFQTISVETCMAGCGWNWNSA
ncbi:MAG: hypothetical protein ACM65K_09855 [Microcoleus sp.]